MITIEKWRQRRINRRCWFCRHSDARVYDTAKYWCKAKSKLVDPAVKRIFYSLYDLEKTDGT